MSYVSVLKNIPELLSQPTGIAAIASLGIHGAIAFLMPLMPVTSSKEASPKTKTVGLVELNQAAQSRLPNSTPLVGIQPPVSVLPQVPPLNLATIQQPPISSLPPLPPAPDSTQLVLPPLPKSPNIAIASLPKSQSLKLASGDFRVPSYSPKVKPFPRYVERVSLGESKPLEYSKVPYNVPPIQPADITREQEMINNAASPYPNQTLTVGDQNNTQLTPGTEVPQETIANQQLVTPIGESPQAGDSSIALGTRSIGQLQAQDSHLKAPDSPSAATQQLIAKTTSFGERFVEVKEQYPDIETKQPIAATVNTKESQTSSVEGDLVINREGQVESINFHNNLVSSEAKTAIREYFRDYFRKNPTQANGKPKFYPFNIALRSNSINTETPEFSPASRTTNLTPQTTDAQRSLIQRLRSPKVAPQLSKPQEENLSRQLRLPKMNLQQSKQPQTNLTQQLRSIAINQQSSPNQPASQNNQQQTSQNQVIIKQTASSSQNNQQQTSRNQTIIRQTASVPETNQGEKPQQEVRANQTSAEAEPSQKLIQQLRQIREKRQNSEQDK